MLALRRALLLRPARRALLSTSVTDPIRFKALAEELDAPLPADAVSRRVLEYLEVDPKLVQRSLSSEQRPLPYKALFAPQQVHLLTPLVRWGFLQLEGEGGDARAADAVFSALEPHANMARGAVWRQYFQRQFFLSGAPLRAYLQAYKNHADALAAATLAVQDEEEEEEEEDEEDEEPHAKVEANGRGKSFFIKSRPGAVLADNKEWAWLPLHVASGVVKELCFRGHFVEALEAYASLPLPDGARREVVTILQDYEQYPSVLYLYEVHRAMGSAVKPLDVAPELEALKKLGRSEEMDARFQELPPKDQSRADIQQLMDN
jgi:hypothetical protein